jgi:hypothetical protein
VISRLSLTRETIEVCPSCGDFVNSLNPRTGFCLDCTPRVCSRCGGVVSRGHHECIRCQRVKWWEENADRLELYISRGLSLSEARRKIKNENRAICISCASPIPGRHRQSTLFCSRTYECRKAKRSYLWKVEKGVPRDIALEQVVHQLIIEQLRELTNDNRV